MAYLSNDLDDHSNQHENNQTLCDEKEHFPLRLKKRQWKLRHQHDQNFLMEGKPLKNKYQPTNFRLIFVSTHVPTKRGQR